MLVRAQALSHWFLTLFSCSAVGSEIVRGKDNVLFSFIVGSCVLGFCAPIAYVEVIVTSTCQDMLMFDQW